MTSFSVTETIQNFIGFMQSTSGDLDNRSLFRLQEEFFSGSVSDALKEKYQTERAHYFLMSSRGHSDPDNRCSACRAIREGNSWRRPCPYSEF